MVIDGVIWSRFDGGFKVSPHGPADYDKDCSWADRREALEEFAQELGVSLKEIL